MVDLLHNCSILHVWEISMKKIFALAAVALVSVALAAADPVLIGHGYLGLGALGSTVENKPDGWNEFKAFGDNLDFGGGIDVNIPFGGYFGVQPGVDFYVNNLAAGNGSDKRGVNYVTLDVPVLFTVKYKKFNFFVGPYFSFALGQMTGWNSKNDGTDKYTHSVDFNNIFNIGLSVGLTYEQRLGMGFLTYGARYMLDFIPVESKMTVGSQTQTSKVGTRRGLVFDIGYKIPLSFFGL